jgi:hypothetical protein
MQPAEPNARFVHPATRIAIAAVERELAEIEAANRAVDAGLEMRTARARGQSMVYSIRLDRGEVEALERHAAANDLKPTVLARNLIRMGLAPGGAAELAVAIDRVGVAVEELRAVAGY